ncbi:MAG: hypothetical protein K2X87_19315 [Gemmataceae bacterium]|nr:hypothetical protein [Gemmataceae bacterium]
MTGPARQKMTPAADPLTDLKAPARPRKPARGNPEAAPAGLTLPPLDGLDPVRACELLGVYPPHQPPPRPPAVPGVVTFWDPGLSLNSLRGRHPHLFCNAAWVEKYPAGKAAALEGWRHLRAVPPGGYGRQAGGLTADEMPAPARAVVTYLALAHLATGEWPDLPRLRTGDVLADSGRRVTVGCFPRFGIDLAGVADDWDTPGLAVVVVPPVPRTTARRRR